MKPLTSPTFAKAALTHPALIRKDQSIWLIHKFPCPDPSYIWPYSLLMQHFKRSEPISQVEGKKIVQRKTKNSTLSKLHTVYATILMNWRQLQTRIPTLNCLKSAVLIHDTSNWDTVKLEISLNDHDLNLPRLHNRLFVIFHIYSECYYQWKDDYELTQKTRETQSTN